MPGNRDIPVPDAGTGEMASPFGQGTAVCPFVDLGGQVNGRDLECPQVAAGVEQVVLYEVKRLACFASEYENDFIKAMIGRSAKVAENTALRKQRELDALTARDRELDMLFERLYPGLGEHTMRHIHRLLQQCLDQAIRDGLIADNPARAFHYPKPKKVSANVLTPSEVED